jgi:AcrR family transcriptional regulator
MPKIRAQRSLPKAATKERVLSAAERLLRLGKAEFSMRDLAAEAGVSFATPFNQFGSKVAIMQALSANRIASMQQRLAAARLSTLVSKRVMAAVKIATEVMLDEPQVNKAIMGVLGTPSSTPSGVATLSAAFWAASIGKGEGLKASTKSIALKVLPGQLRFGFRGVLSFWTAGEFTDDELLLQAQAAAAAVLFGFVAAEGRAELEQCLAAS